jgi:prefoldin subunit 5
MSIQSKISEIKDATRNLNGMIEGLKGLSEQIVPDERIREVLRPTIDILDTNVRTVLDQCRQEIGEAVQICQSVEARLSADIAQMKADIADLRETLDGFAEAANKRRRRA